MEMLLLTRCERAVLLSIASAVLYMSPLLQSAEQWQFLFLYDDRVNFASNPILQGDFLFSWENLARMATMRRINVYEPLSWLLKALAVQCVGMDSRAIRIVTAMLHFTAGCVLVKVSMVLIEINNLLSTQPLRSNKAFAPACGDVQVGGSCSHPYFLGCCLSTLLYLVHPIHVEVVAWPSAQPYALAALFANLSMLCYFQKISSQLRSRGAVDRDEGDTSFMKLGIQQDDWLVAGLYFCSVLSKSVTVLLPVAFFLVDLLVVCKLNNSHHRRIRLTPHVVSKWIVSKALVLFVMLSFIGVTIWSNDKGSVDVISLSLPERILKTAMAPAWTFRQILWPARLRVHYQIREDDLDLLGNSECLLSVAALVLCSLAGVWHWRQHNAPQLLLALAYYVIMMLPTSSLVQHGVVSLGCDRYVYFPSAVFVPFGGILLGKYLCGDDSNEQVESKPRATAIGADDKDQSEHVAYNKALISFSSKVLAKQPLPRRQVFSHSRRIFSRWAIFVTMLSSSVWLSAIQMETWRSERALYAHGVSKDRSDWRVYEWQGKDHLTAEPDLCAADPQHCRLSWELALVFAPNTTLKAKLVRSQILFALDQRIEACRMIEELLPEHPESLPLLNNIGVCRFHDGMLDEARALFHKAAHMTAYEGAQETAVENLQSFDVWMAAFRVQHGDRAPTPEERGSFAAFVMW